MKRLLMVMLVLFISVSAIAYEPIVKKNTFKMNSYTTVGDEKIKNLKVGWEAYGKLNEAKDNVILICHYFSGNSHAAGKYSKTDKNSGYWDKIIGSGKPVDTDKFYVISVDTLANIGFGNPNVITTGPASINPATGKPYGMNFPMVTILDFVNIQKAVLNSLGIKKLHAVIGASMGAFQTYEWASAYPEMVSRIIPIVGSGWASGDFISLLNIWKSPIELDSDWCNGNYYDKNPPLKGLRDAFKTIYIQGGYWEWANETFGRMWAEEDKDPCESMGNQFKIESAMDSIGNKKAKTADANHFLYTTKACQVFVTGDGEDYEEGLRDIEASTLIIYSDEDRIFVPEDVLKTAELIRADNTPVDIFLLEGKRGHYNGVMGIGQAGKTIKKFLEK